MTESGKSEKEIRDLILGSIHAIAPEVNLATLDPETPLRDQIDIDSMDFFNLMVNLHKKLGVDIPEADYAKLRTLSGAVGYLLEKMKSPSFKTGT